MPKSKFVVLIFAVIQLAAQVGLLFREVEYIVATLTIDDSYYYFQTAWNLKQFGFPTFDGLNPTNGVQLLWFWLLALIAWFVPTKLLFLKISLATGFLLNAFCHFSIWRIAKAIERPPLAIWMSGLWFLLNVGSVAYWRGLENSLHAAIFWAAIWQVVVYLKSVERGSRSSLWGVTLLLILNAWARIDAAVFSAILYIYCIVATPPQLRNNKEMAGTGLLALGGAILQLALFKWMGGSYLPVSALVKGTGWKPGFGLFRPLLQLGLPPGLPEVSGVFGLLLFFLVRLITDLKDETERSWFNLWQVLLLGNIVHLIILAPGGIPYWYRTPEYVFWVITIATIALMIQRFFAQTRFKAVSKILPLASTLLVLIFGGVIYAEYFSLFYSKLYSARYSVAIWMSQNLDDDTICASWNAGQLGFFSQRRVINLDGLINSAEYYRTVLNGNMPLTEYLYNNQVDCIVDYTDERVPVHFPVIQEFPAADRPIRIWRVVSPQEMERTSESP